MRWLEAPNGPVPNISGQLRIRDTLGAWKARWGIGRMTFLVPPGLYAIGSPGGQSPVMVTANYKMSYDLVRKSLSGRNAWLLVLETFGINVWCAAGKGSFGTDELVRRIRETDLTQVVSHRNILLPILGAPGVAAHIVTKQTGFQVHYATIKAADLPEYLDNGMVTTPAMREMTFTLRERLVLVPVEVMAALKKVLPASLLLFLIGWGLGDVFAGLAASSALLGAFAAGAIVVPCFLPWLPGPSFAVKGAIVGLVWSVIWALFAGSALGFSVVAGTSLVIMAVSSFYALNFTGSTPFTSLSGVRKEIRLALPIMAMMLVGAALFWGWAVFS